MSIKRRLENLEDKQGDHALMVIVQQYVNSDQSIAIAESYESNTGQLIHRAPGESDDDMIARAIPDRDGRMVILLPFNFREQCP